MIRQRRDVKAVALICALGTGAPCAAADDKLSPPLFSLTGGAGNAMGWYGVQGERYLRDGRLSIFGGVGYAATPDEPVHMSGTMAAAGGCRAFFGGPKHPFVIESSVSLISRGWWFDESGLMRQADRYGPGVQLGYQLISRKGITFAVSLGAGYAVGAHDDSVGMLSGLAIGYTWRRP